MEYVTEEQQWEQFKKWIKKYGNILSWVLIGILALLLAGRYWQHHQTVIQEAASENYMSLIIGMEQHDETTVKSKAALLKEEYPRTIYTTLASFVLAEQAIKNNDHAEAQKQLDWVIAHSPEAKFKSLAQVRLMRLLIAQNKLKEALNYYDEKAADGFVTLMTELKGDILLKQQDMKGAKAAYEKALNEAPEEGMHGLLLKMKLADLGGEAKANE